MARLILTLLLALVLLPTWAQQRHGRVFVSENGEEVPVPGAVIRLGGTRITTVADSTGEFWLPAEPAATHVVVTFVGLRTDSIRIKHPQHIHVVLQPDAATVDAVELVQERAGTYRQAISAENREVITQKELFRAACCNLSESFATNPSVDVSFADAVTGTRQIQLLGLSGIYTQLTTELLPNPRGVMSAYGLALVPGTWLQSIQLTKGPGTVSSGFESMAGHINVELKKPGERFLDFNTYVNAMGRTEMNVEAGTPVTKRLSTALMVHGNLLNRAPDMNDDSFADIPRGRQLNVLQRWRYDLGRGWMSQLAVNWLHDDRRGGQLNGIPVDNGHSGHAGHSGMPQMEPWIYKNQINRANVWAKLGWVDKSAPYRSAGLQVQYTAHDQQSGFGLRPYNARENTLWVNGLWQDIFGTTTHQYRAGVSLLVNHVNESLQLTTMGADTAFVRREVVPGIWGEYTWQPSERVALVLGSRLDHHNYYGAWLTPRAHFRYDLTEATQLRLSAGTGRRTANIWAENSLGLASGRVLSVIPTGGYANYGLKQEASTNVGGSLTHDFELNSRKGSLHADYYYTRFQNQVVADYDASVRELRFYNLTNASNSHAAQVEGNYSPIYFMELRLAYRWQQVRTRYTPGWLQRPLTPRQRAFGTVAFTALDKRLTLDYTVTYTGSQRLPTTAGNRAENVVATASPDFWQMHTQVAYKVRPWFTVYAGVENLTDFTQHRLILASDQPFDSQFDTGYVWGPVIGRMTYGGIRVMLK